MRKFLAILLGCFFLMTGTAMATLTSIKAAPSSEVNIDTILTDLYGAGNYLRIDDDLDKIWMNLNGGAVAKAKYAADEHEFGYIDTSDVYRSLFNVQSNYFGTIYDDISGKTLGSADVLTFKWALRDLSVTNQYTSDPSDNNGLDHMVTWLITGGDEDLIGSYVIAWEDRNDLDWDYNDLVVEITNAAPVPEPATMLLLGSGLIGLAGLGRKKFLKKT